MAMTYVYDGPGVTRKDTIRYLLQDTDPDGAGEWLLSDEEISWHITEWGDIWHSDQMIASFAAETIAARYAREASYSADGVSISLGPVGDQYRALAASLRERHKMHNVGGFPDIGGVTPNEPMEPNTKPFAFGKGIHDFVEAGQQEFGGIYPPEQEVGNWGIPDYEKIVEP
jgi:hypothetical protein